MDYTQEQLEMRYLGRILQDEVALENAKNSGPHTFSNAGMQSIWQEIKSTKSTIVLNQEKFISVLRSRHKNLPPDRFEQLQVSLSGFIQAGKDITGDEFQEYQERLLGIHNEWGEIESLDCPNLPPFPVEELPASLRDWVKDLSHATQTPPEMAALFTLAVVSLAVCRWVEVEARPGWIETVNLYVAILMGPGNRKSRVVSEVTEPVRIKEADEIELAKPIVARKQSEKRQAEARLKKLEKDAAESGDREAHEEAGKLSEELSRIPDPVFPRRIVEDATPEKLTTMVAEQGGCLASISAEGGVLEGMKGRYSKNSSPNFEVYLHGHSADPLIVDRIGRPSVTIPKPRLTCAYAIQPTVIQGLGDEFRGRGLVGRFLYAYPQSLIGQREISPDPVSQEIRTAYCDTILDLLEIDEEVLLTLTPEASETFLEWELEIEQMLDIGGDMEHFRDWGAKLAGATLRIAALLHCVEDWRKGSVERSTINSAVSIARSLIPHADAVLSLMQAKESPVEEDAKYLVSWIKRHNKRRFTKTEAQHQCKRRFPKATDIDPVLQELVRRRYLRLWEPPNPGPGRPPSPRYISNPEIFKPLEKCSQYSRNPASSSVSVNSRNNGSATAARGRARPIDAYSLELQSIDPRLYERAIQAANLFQETE